MIAFSLRTFYWHPLLLFLLISVNGKTYKSAINRPIKIRTHHVVQKHTDRLTNGRQAVRVDRQPDNVQMDRQADFSKSDSHM